jgi:Arc/MetJ-type ribon-helix-helix transcriptional regulator
MAQLNLHVTPEFEEALEAFRQGRQLASKSEAIRLAVREAAAPYLAGPERDFSLLEGLLDAHRPAHAAPKAAADLERELDVEMERVLGPDRVPGR